MPFMNASGNCLGVSIQSSVLNAYLGSVMSMPLGWLPRAGGGPVPMDMVVRYNFLQSLRKTVDGRFGIRRLFGKKLCGKVDSGRSTK